MSVKKGQQVYHLKFPKYTFNIPILLIVTSVIISVNSVVNSVGKINYEIILKQRVCTSYTNLIANVSCPAKRINRTAEQSGFDLFVKPGATLGHLCVCKHFNISKHFY